MRVGWGCKQRRRCFGNDCDDFLFYIMTVGQSAQTAYYCYYYQLAPELSARSYHN